MSRLSDRLADAALLRVLAQIDRQAAAAHAALRAKSGALRAHFARGVSVNRSLAARLRGQPKE